MFSLIAFPLLFGCAESNSKSQYLSSDLYTMLPTGSHLFVLVKAREESHFKNSHLLLIENGSISTDMDLGDDAFYQFNQIRNDSIFINRLVLTEEMRVKDFVPKYSYLNFGKYRVEIGSKPFYGSGEEGLPECKIDSSFIEGSTFQIKCPDKDTSYNLSNIFFMGEAIYYYELRRNVLGSSFLGYQKKLSEAAEYRPILNPIKDNSH